MSSMMSGTILYLLKRGAHREPLRITTGELAEGLSISQQTASRRLLSLEKEGIIKRKDGGILLSKKAVSEARSLLRGLLASLDEERLVFEGKVVTGLGEGAYYFSKEGYMRQFKKKLGFSPFAGTLNLSIPPEDIDKRMLLREKKPIEISGFKSCGRSFGRISAYRAVAGGIPSAIVFPERSTHGLQVLEIVAPSSLRKKLGLQDGSSLQVELV
ncbi:MAG: DUF120 domain-containing protein [Candidatus Micrarchaeia archaeon]